MASVSEVRGLLVGTFCSTIDSGACLSAEVRPPNGLDVGCQEVDIMNPRKEEATAGGVRSFCI
jgi:hypothetical protein